MASLAKRPIGALSCCAMHDAAAGKAAEEQTSNLVPVVTFLARDSYYDQASSNMIVGSRRCVCKDMDVRGSTVRGASGQRSFPSFAGEVDRRCLAETRTPDPEGTLDANAPKDLLHQLPSIAAIMEAVEVSIQQVQELASVNGIDFDGLKASSLF